jgi:hypothetical protein
VPVVMSMAVTELLLTFVTQATRSPVPGARMRGRGQGAADDQGRDAGAPAGTRRMHGRRHEVFPPPYPRRPSGDRRSPFKPRRCARKGRAGPPAADHRRDTGTRPSLTTAAGTGPQQHPTQLAANDVGVSASS